MILWTTVDGNPKFVRDDEGTVRREVVDSFASDAIRSMFLEVEDILGSSEDIARLCEASARETDPNTDEDRIFGALLRSHAPIDFNILSAHLRVRIQFRKVRAMCRKAVNAGILRPADLPLALALWARALGMSNGTRYATLGTVSSGIVLPDWRGGRLNVLDLEGRIDEITIYDREEIDECTQPRRARGHPKFALYKLVDFRGHEKIDKIIRHRRNRRATVLVLDPYAVSDFHLWYVDRNTARFHHLSENTVLHSRYCSSKVVVVLDGRGMTETDLEAYCINPPPSEQLGELHVYMMVDETIDKEFIDFMNQAHIPPILVGPRGIRYDPIANELKSNSSVPRRMNDARRAVVRKQWGCRLQQSHCVGHSAPSYPFRWSRVVGMIPPHRVDDGTLLDRS